MVVGRFIGSLVLRFVKPGRLLAFNATVAIALLLIAISSGGRLAMWSVLAIGLFNSIMFPTIFTLAIEGLGIHTSQASSLLVMAIVGGAIIPPLQGWVADSTGSLQLSFLVPLVCYAYIVYYGFAGYKIKPVDA